MKIAVLSALLFCLVLPSACWAFAPNSIRNKLQHNTTIQGYPCARGSIWFYPSGALNQCVLARVWTVGDAHIPRNSILILRSDGTVDYVLLSHDTVIDGYRSEGGAFMGTAEGVVTAFYPSERVLSLYLTKDHMIQGVPCRGNGWSMLSDPIGNGNQVEFYEEGKLRGCKLTRDYGGGKKGQRIELEPTAGPAESMGSF